MNVDEVFLKELYSEFSKKSSSVDKYLQMLVESNKRINEKSIALVEALQEKYKILADFRSKKAKVNPANQFSIESSFDRETIEMADESLKQAEEKIEQIKKSVNHEFSSTKEELKALTTLLNKEATTINEIYDTWVGIIEHKE